MSNTLYLAKAQISWNDLKARTKTKSELAFDNSKRPYLAPLPIDVSNMMAGIKRKTTPSAHRKTRMLVKRLAIRGSAPVAMKVPVIKKIKAPSVKGRSLSYQERRELEGDRLCAENGY